MARHGKRSNKRTFADIQRDLGKELPRVMRAVEALGGDRKLSAAGAMPAVGGSSAYSSPWASGQASQVPPMDKVSEDRPPMKEIGAPGTAIFWGIITSEEYNPDLYWREAVRMWDTMRRNDYQIAATLLMQELPIRGAQWKVEPADDSPDAIEQASLIETALFHELDDPWDDVVRHALIMNWAGFMVMEKVFRIHDDGTVFWQKFAPRLPRTIWRWWINEQNDLKGIQQWTFQDYTYKYLDIPREKIMLFTNRKEGNNFEGMSDLRTAYKPWWIKEALLKIMGIGYEREHVGIPVITLPEGYTKDDEKRAADIGKGIRANEMAYITLPPGWGAEWLKSGSAERKGSGILEAIYLCDIAIARNILGQFINLGSGETGSYALSSDQSQLFLMSLQAKARYVADVFNLEAIPQLINYNFKGVERGMYPKLVCQRIQSFDFEKVGAALGQLASAGLLRPDLELEDYVRDMIGVPSAPDNPVEATTGEGQVDQGPAQDSTGQPGDVQTGGTATQQMTRAMEGRTFTTATQRRIFMAKFNESVKRRKPYRILTDPEFAQRINRRMPFDPLHQRRMEQMETELMRGYKTLQRDVLALKKEAV